MFTLYRTVPDPDLEIMGGGGGGGSSRPLDKGGGGQSLKTFFSVWSRNKVGGGGRGPRTPSLDPPLRDSFCKGTGENYYRIGLLFTHEKDDFGAISVTERSCPASMQMSLL